MHKASGDFSDSGSEGSCNSMRAVRTMSKTRSFEETKEIDDKSTYLHIPISVDNFCTYHISQCAADLWRKLKTLVINKPDWSIKITREKLALKINRSPRTVSRRLAELESVGLLEKIVHRGKCYLLKVRFPQALEAINFRLTVAKNGNLEQPHSYVLYNTKNNNNRTVVDSKIDRKKPNDNPIVVNLNKNNINLAPSGAAEDVLLEGWRAELNKINTEIDKIYDKLPRYSPENCPSGKNIVNYLIEFRNSWTDEQRTAEVALLEQKKRRDSLLHAILCAEHRKKIEQKKPSCRVLTEKDEKALCKVLMLAPRLSCEVRYSVTRGALSKFDTNHAICIANKLIREGRWTTPSGYKENYAMASH